jgi:tRNA-dihydrouridine synthase B
MLMSIRSAPPSREEIVRELLWVVDRAEEHFGTRRAAPYLRKFYPWYLERLGESRRAREPFQQTTDLDEARDLVRALCDPAPSERLPAPTSAPSLAYS